MLVMGWFAFHIHTWRMIDIPRLYMARGWVLGDIRLGNIITGALTKFPIFLYSKANDSKPYCYSDNSFYRPFDYYG